MESYYWEPLDRVLEYTVPTSLKHEISVENCAQTLAQINGRIDQTLESLEIIKLRLAVIQHRLSDENLLSG
jgi:hypothetical protein